MGMGSRQALLLGLALTLTACSEPMSDEPPNSAPVEAKAVRLSASDWSAIPGENDLNRCMPTSTDIRNGAVTLRCRVAQNGSLQACSATVVGERRLRPWALCLSEVFRAKGHGGVLVEIPITWVDPS